MDVIQVAVKADGFDVILELEVYNVHDLLLGFLMVDGEDYLHAAVEVSVHPVGGAYVKAFVTIVVKVKNPRML